MGVDINVHDQWAVESQGRIQDRTRGAPRLRPTRPSPPTAACCAKSIEQVEKGERPILAVGADEAARLRGPVTIDGIGPTRQDWRPTRPTPIASGASAPQWPAARRSAAERACTA